MSKVTVVYTTDSDGEPFILGVFAETDKATRFVSKLEGCGVDGVYLSEEVVE